MILCQLISSSVVLSPRSPFSLSRGSRFSLNDHLAALTGFWFGPLVLFYHFQWLWDLSKSFSRLSSGFDYIQITGLSSFLFLHLCIWSSLRSLLPAFSCSSFQFWARWFLMSGQWYPVISGSRPGWAFHGLLLGLQARPRICLQFSWVNLLTPQGLLYCSLNPRFEAFACLVAHLWPGETQTTPWS